MQFNHHKIASELINKFCNTGIGAELGIHNGMTSREILNNTSIKHLYMIDTWASGYSCEINDSTSDLSQSKQEKIYKSVKRKFGEKFESRHTLIREATINAANQVPNDIDFVFVDACHEYEDVMKDIETWFPKIKKFGLVMGHDWSRSFPGVVRAVTDFFTEYKFIFPPFVDYKSFDFKYNYVPAPSEAPVISKSWPQGNVWWAIKCC